MNLSRFCLLVFALGLLACKTQEAPRAETAEKPAESKGHTLLKSETEIRFVIVSNSAGPITGRFPDGLTGELDADGTGKVEIQLDTLKTVDQNNVENPLRDGNVIEAFFGVRPSAVFPEPVDEAWSALAGKLERSIQKATFEITSSPGIHGTATLGSLEGNLKLWKTISIPLSFPVSITRSADRMVLTSTDSVTFDLEQVLGSELRKSLFDTMLAAGCAHQPGIQNQVEITLEKVTLVAR
jgi:hypothetical protein